MLTADEISRMIADVFRLHGKFPRKPEKAFRKFDGKTPYGVHPTFLAMLVAQEESLAESFRVTSIKALLGHDLLEDTTAPLPEWCKDSRLVETLIHELTFTKDQDPLVDIWTRSQWAILLKFYDNVANLMCVGKMPADRVAQRKEHVRKHLEWVEGRYPGLEIIKIARGLLG